MKLYFVRHGESEANLLREFSNRGLRHGLTAKGREQAVGLARQFERMKQFEGVKVARLFSSPLLRAIQTAEILSETLKIPYEITEALREYDCGILEGKSDPASWEIYSAVQRDWFEYNKWESRIEQGESFLDIQARFMPFIETLVETYRHTQETIIMIGHGGLYYCVLPQILTNIDVPFVLTHPIGNTAYVAAESGAAGLNCLSWCGNALTPDS